jgi:hypothetical protein
VRVGGVLVRWVIGVVRIVLVWVDVEGFVIWGHVEGFVKWGDVEGFVKWGDVEEFVVWVDVEGFVKRFVRSETWGSR